MSVKRTYPEIFIGPEVFVGPLSMGWPLPPHQGLMVELVQHNCKYQVVSISLVASIAEAIQASVVRHASGSDRCAWRGFAYQIENDESCRARTYHELSVLIDSELAAGRCLHAPTRGEQAARFDGLGWLATQVKTRLREIGRSDLIAAVLPAQSLI